jgi:hypothetical protein
LRELSYYFQLLPHMHDLGQFVPHW